MRSTESPDAAVLQSRDMADSEDVLDSILNSSREGMLIIDSSMRTSAANGPAHEVFMRPAGSLVGRRLTEVVRDFTLHDAFRAALTTNTATDLRIELNLVEKRTYDVHIAPIRLDQTAHAVGIFYDVSKLERLEKVRQEFLSNISHELRTPLTSILAYVETLEDSAIDDPENSRRFLAVIRRNAERMRSLISDIAELSQIETGNVSLDVRRLNLGHAVDEIFVSLSSKAAARQIELVNEVDGTAAVEADSLRLEQMLINLIDNAIKFNREGGRVTVSFADTIHANVISISDTGDGILPENLQRIFERFYRIDRGRTRDVGGTGLGLAIVKHLAKLHGGDVSVSSTLGQGTTFSIELPSH